MKELDIIPREQHETSKNYAKRILIHNILTFRLEPGEQFQDKVIAECINVSRTPVHEAVLELSNQHIVDIFPNKGTRTWRTIFTRSATPVNRLSPHGQPNTGSRRI